MYRRLKVRSHGCGNSCGDKPYHYNLTFCDGLFLLQQFVFTKYQYVYVEGFFSILWPKYESMIKVDTYRCKLYHWKCLWCKHLSKIWLKHRIENSGRQKNCTSYWKRASVWPLVSSIFISLMLCLTLYHFS